MNQQVNRNNKRDEKRIDRLSSFLYQKGKLDCKTIQPVKSHVFHVMVQNGTHYILKKHANLDVLEQQWRFFDQMQSLVVVSFERFPNRKRYIKHNGYFWTIAPFIEGEKLHYAYEQDRRRSVRALQRFHQDARTVTIKHPLKRRLFYLRWADRLKAFRETESYFFNHGFATLFRDIVKQTENHLYNVAQLPWSRMEWEARKKGEWVHGDVAGHNFIHGRNTRMIDFDLLAATPVLYDYIQLGQRFLPYIAWDIDTLLDYQMVPETETSYWVQAMLVPADVMREWLHFLKNHENEAIGSYLAKMEIDWIERQYFLKKASLVLKSW